MTNIWNWEDRGLRFFLQSTDQPSRLVSKAVRGQVVPDEERRPGLRLRTGSTGLAGRRDVDYGAGTRPVTAQSTPDHRAGWRRLWAEMRVLWERFFEKWSTRLASGGYQPSGPKWTTCATRRPYWLSLWSSSYVPSTPQKVIFKNTLSLAWYLQMLELCLSLNEKLLMSDEALRKSFGIFATLGVCKLSLADARSDFNF